MNEKQARSMLLYTVVVGPGGAAGDDSDTETGVVMELGGDAFFVRWQYGGSGWIKYNDAKHIIVR